MPADEEIKAIDDRISEVVEEAVKFAEESPWPDMSEVTKGCVCRSELSFHC